VKEGSSGGPSQDRARAPAMPADFAALRTIRIASEPDGLDVGAGPSALR